jgi:putative NIF3 family GTP cyclohydrolase 1 type 2
MRMCVRADVNNQKCVIASEMSHADVLDANAKGIIVLLAGQSMIERAYLRQLRVELQEEYAGSDWNAKIRCSQVDCSALYVV